jgi:hypothetical protein
MGFKTCLLALGMCPLAAIVIGPANACFGSVTIRECRLTERYKIFASLAQEIEVVVDRVEDSTPQADLRTVWISGQDAERLGMRSFRLPMCTVWPIQTGGRMTLVVYRGGDGMWRTPCGWEGRWF